MKLKCDAHKRRVHAVEGKFVHRSGENCNSKTATIGDKTFPPDSQHFH